MEEKAWAFHHDPPIRYKVQIFDLKTISKYAYAENDYNNYKPWGYV